MVRHHAQTADPADSAVLERLEAALMRKLSAAGIPATAIGEGTCLFETGAVDSQGLLDLILEVEDGVGRVFDPARIDFERGITLGQLAGAFVESGLPPPAASSAPAVEKPAPAAPGAARGARGEGAGERSAPLVRPAVPADVEPLCRLLEQGFPESGIKAAEWGRLFDHNWSGNAFDRGLVLAVENEIVGFLGTLYAERWIGGEARLVCNFSSWYVRPEHRGWAVALLAAATRSAGLTYTSFTPSPTARQAFGAMRFVELDTRRIFMPPLWHAETLRGTGPLIHFDPGLVRGALNGRQRRVFDDHAPYDCLQLVVSDGPDYAYLVVKRRAQRPLRRLKWLFPAKVPYSEILHCSSPELLERHLERVKLAVLRKQKTVALVADARLWPARPRGLPIATHACYRSSLINAGDIDKLYSEFVLLPL